MAKITIIGGGIAGCTTALELAKQGHEIIILEEKDDILKGTSANTPGRMGLGYHYFHSETAIRYMKQTIGFMKKYNECFLGSEDISYLRDGRYFITKNSFVDYQELMANYDEVNLEYEKFCQEDESNKIFKTFHIHKTLHRKDFKDDVNLEKVAYAIETKERLLNWQKFSEVLKMELRQFEKKEQGKGSIEIKTMFKVSDIEMQNDGKFKLFSKYNFIKSADYVINCTWQNIEKINEKLGIGSSHFKKEDPKQSITSRLKLLVEVELPESLKEKHSMFFCVGPHCMFSNLGGGIGRITYAPVTNFGITTESEMPQSWQRWLSKGLNQRETEKYGEKIIEGVAEYIPAMKEAKIKQVIPGIVKSKGSVEIEDKNSPFHERDYSGVEEQQIGWIDNASMKLFYCLGNSKEVAEILKRQEYKKEKIREIIDFTNHEEISNEQMSEVDRGIFGQFFVNSLQRNFTSKDLLPGKNEINNLVSTKSSIIREAKAKALEKEKNKENKII